MALDYAQQYRSQRILPIPVGELVLISPHPKNPNAYLGPFSQFWEGALWRNRVIVEPALDLRKDLPYTGIKRSDFRSASLSLPCEIYVGKTDILEVLRTWEGFESHAQVLENLTFPFGQSIEGQFRNKRK